MDRKRVKALIKKEFYQIVRDPSSLLISGFLPLILIFIYAYGVSLDLDHLRLGIVTEDSSAEVSTLIESFRDSRYFELKVAHNQEAFLDDIVSGALRGFVVIPSYFSSFYKRPPNVAPMQVIADGSEPNTANFVQNYARGAFTIWKQQQGYRPLVNIQPRFWYNEQLESRNFLIPGALGIIMTLIGTLLTALVVAREWERGTMEALMSTPVTIGEILVGKLIPYFCLAMMSLIICVVIAVGFFGIPFRGSFLLLGLVTSFFLVPALGVGLFISTVAKNQFVAAQVAIIASFLPAFILSGFIFEISSMPTPIQWISALVPARYFVSCTQTLFLAGNVWPLILFNLIPMVLVGILFFFLTWRKSEKRLDA